MSSDDSIRRVLGQESKIVGLTDDVFKTKTELSSRLNEFKYLFREQSELLSQKMNNINEQMNIYEICKDEDEEKKDENGAP